MLRKLGISFGVLALVAVSAIGCSRYVKEQRAEWRSEAEKACIRSGAVKETQYVKISRALEGPGTCGADYPVKVTAFAMDPSAITSSSPGLFGLNRSPSMLTKLNQEGTFTCPMYSSMSRWLEQVVQPAAMARFGQLVVEVRTMGTYSCRRMNNGSRSARMSEHSYANAIDIGGFRLADGSIVSILNGWNGGLEEQNFLREVHGGACRHFATVLGPGVALHHDHFHFDMAKHGRRGDRSICRPYPQPVSPPNEGFPVNPAARNIEISERRAPLGHQDRDVYAYAPQRQPGSGPMLPPGAVGGAVGGAAGALPTYRPAQLPIAPRNLMAEREAQELRQAPPRTPYQPQMARKPGEPVLLYGKGQGPFLPLKEHEIDPADLDDVTGSVGE